MRWLPAAYKTKKPRLFSRDCLVFKIHHHETVVSAFRLPLTQFHAGFVCNFLSSSAGINLCSCFSRLALVFRLSLGFHFHGLLPLPLLFLTSAVFAPFRSLQFWILTTQPLFLPFPFFPIPPHSGFLSAPPSLSFLRFSPFFPAWFPMPSFPVPGTQPRCMFPFALP